MKGLILFWYKEQILEKIYYMIHFKKKWIQIKHNLYVLD